MNLDNYIAQQRTYTPTQLDIIESDKFPIYIKAGAGSGKTEVLINKIINILTCNTGISLKNFAIITFTNKAANQMKSRLRDRLYIEWLKWMEGYPDSTQSQDFWRKQLELCDMVDISTIHAFCEKLLRKYGLTIGIALNFSVQNIGNFLNKASVDVLNTYADNEHLADIPLYKISSLLRKFYEQNQSKGFDLDIAFKNSMAISKDSKLKWKEVKECFLDAYIELDKKVNFYKVKNNILTPDDLVKDAATLLNTTGSISNNYALAQVIGRYKYFFMDEFQDTNRNQFELVNSLTKNGVNIFLVGDEKQSIYRFRGADIKNSIEMGSLISRSQSVGFHMTDNFRTDTELLSIINKIFSYRFRYCDQDLNSPVRPLTQIEQLQNKNAFEKPLRVSIDTKLSDIIKYLVINERTINDIPLPYSDIAVLFRSNYDLDQTAIELKKHQIPVEVFGGKGFFRTKEVIDVYKLLNYIIIGNSVAKNELYFTDFYDSIRDSKRFELFLSELSDSARFESIDRLLGSMYIKSQLFDYYISNRRYQSIANLKKLKEIVNDSISMDFFQPIEFVSYLHSKIISHQEEEEAELSVIDRKDGMVSLLSIHKAKGLEFPVVIIPHFDKKLLRFNLRPRIVFSDKHKKIGFDKDDFVTYPNEVGTDSDFTFLNVTEEKEMLEEEIRILYVALTRAKNMLILSYDKNSEPDIRNSHPSWGNWLYSIDNGKVFEKHRFEFADDEFSA